MAYVVAQPCIGTIDRACVEVCPVQCFYEGGDQLIIHPSECVDCDACKPVCPVAAIFPESEVPAEWRHFIQKNADFIANTPNLVRAKTKTEVEEAGLSSAEVCAQAVAAPAEAAPVLEAPAALVPPAAAPPLVGVAAPPVPAAAPPAPAPAAGPVVEGPKPAAAPKPAAPPGPVALRDETYKRAKELLYEVVAMQSGSVPADAGRFAAAVALAGEIRAEINKAMGKETWTLADLEKRSITLRQGEELARALIQASRGATEFEVRWRERKRAVAEHLVGFVVTSLLTIGAAAFAAYLGLMRPKALGIPLSTDDILRAPLDPEAMAPVLAFTLLVVVFAPFALYAAYRVVRGIRELLALWRFREQKRLGLRLGPARAGS